MQYLLTGCCVGVQHPYVTYTAILPGTACIIPLFMVVFFKGIICQVLVRKNIIECRYNWSLAKY